MLIKKEILEKLRLQYPVGCRVELVRMNDVQAPPVGTRGTVLGVDDIGSIMVRWDNGSGLNVAYGEDICRRLTFDVDKNRIGVSDPVFLTKEYVICKTNRDYDFVATIENKTDLPLRFDFDGEYESFTIQPHNWIGFCDDNIDVLEKIIQHECDITEE